MLTIRTSEDDHVGLFLKFEDLLIKNKSVEHLRRSVAFISGKPTCFTRFRSTNAVWTTGTKGFTTICFCCWHILEVKMDVRQLHNVSKDVDDVNQCNHRVRTVYCRMCSISWQILLLRHTYMKNTKVWRSCSRSASTRRQSRRALRNSLRIASVELDADVSWTQTSLSCSLMITVIEMTLETQQSSPDDAEKRMFVVSFIYLDNDGSEWFDSSCAHIPALPIATARMTQSAQSNTRLSFNRGDERTR